METPSKPIPVKLSDGTVFRIEAALLGGEEEVAFALPDYGTDTDHRRHRALEAAADLNSSGSTSCRVATHTPFANLKAPRTEAVAEVNTLIRFAVALVAALFAWVVPSLASAEQWVSIGPFGTPLQNNDVISGQVNALAVDPRDANIVYLGASEGGVWKTRDGGGSWIPLTDTQLVRKLASGITKATLSIGALAVHPANPQVVYAGTGDPNIAAFAFGPALGVFRSTDAGGSWTAVGANPLQAGCENGAVAQAVVNRILVVSGRMTLVHAATNVGLFSLAEDGSDCWKRSTNGLPISGNAIDLVADPYQQVLYVAFWSRGIFRSTNVTGTQWTMLAGGLPTSGFGRIALAFGGRTGIGFGQPLPLLYAGFDGLSRGYRLFTTRDAGATWTELPSPPSDGQLSFNNTIAVGSYSSDEVYIGQIGLWRSTDGGRMGGKNNYGVDPPVTTNSWTGLSCCLSHANPWRKGLDLHGDLHDIVFAPYGSFLPTPEQVQVVYVASDGGVTRGDIDFEGVVSWKALTKGLAIGQIGTIGLDPGLASVTVAGYWHNGDILSVTTLPDALAIIGGDGFQTTIDAGNLTVYFNCNAGFGGSICRATPPAPFATSFATETIWSDQTSSKMWSDPHRPGHLLRLQAGLLFRTTVANTAAASMLDTPAAWQAVQPRGTTGQITTMAFRSRLLEAQPVYYVGTSVGQIWRGSPEVPWTKICECGATINAIAPELFTNERIFAVTNRSSSPGRIKEITRTFTGSWEIRDIDAAFKPELDVSQITSVVADPAVPAGQGRTIYVGTDQGAYRGRLEPLVIDSGVKALLDPVTTFENWVWRRSPGVPNVWVTDLEVHQSLAARDRSGIVRAGTYGRGIFELDRQVPTVVIERKPITLSVHALQMGMDGPASPLTVKIPVAIKGYRDTRETPFDVPLAEGAEITLEAPREIRTRNAILEFQGWALPGHRSGRRNTITVKAGEAAKAIAYYEEEKLILDPKAKPFRLTASAAARAVCVQSLTHEVVVTWQILGGQRPAKVRLEITTPDRQVENVELKPIEGSQAFPMTYPAGGDVTVKATAMDSGGGSAATQSSVQLQACPRR